MRELLALGTALIVIGFALVFLSTVLSARESGAKTGVKAGGIILVGPIPIVFGTDESAVFWAVVLGLAALVLAYVAFFSGLVKW